MGSEVVFGSFSKWITKGINEGNPFALASAVITAPLFALADSL